MPAITALTVSAATPVARALAILAGRARRGLKQLAEKVKNRHDAMRAGDPTSALVWSIAADEILL